MPYRYPQWLPALTSFPEDQRDRAAWVMASGDLHEDITLDFLIADAMANRASPYYEKLNLRTNVLVNKARRKIMQDELRKLVVIIRRGPLRGERHRAFISVLDGGTRAYLPTRLLVTRPTWVREVETRANGFIATWTRHRNNVLALSRLSPRPAWC